MASLCFLTTCMGRLKHLRRTLGLVAAQPNSDCVVVDYSCPDRCGDWVAANHPGIHVVRVPGMTSFNRSHAANVGCVAVEAPWICFIDCDVLVDPDFSWTVQPLLEPGRYYCPEPIRDWALCGTFICSREDFDLIGGYDESYRGWGERDFDVYNALEFVGRERRSFPSSLVSHIPHGERSRVRFHEVKERHVAQAVNRIYRFVKFDVMHVTGTPLPPKAREDLYERVSSRTRQALHEGEPLGLVIDVSGSNFALSYEISGSGGRPVSRLTGRIHRSLLINRLHRFGKVRFLRRSLDLTKAIHDRHLPFGRRLDLRLTSHAMKREPEG